MSLYLYATLNTLNHRPLHLSEHLHKLWEGAKALYGSTPDMDVADIEQMVVERLGNERMPRGGNLIKMRIEHSSDGWRVSLHNPTPTIYEGYSYLTLRPSALIINHELPFSRWRTTCSSLTTEFGQEFAERNGAGIALRADRAGNLISSGDNPLFLVSKGRLHTLPIEDGGRNSVERDLMFRLCRYAGIEILESHTPLDRLDQWEEIIIFEPNGIRSVGSCSGHSFDYSIALRLERYLHRLL